MRSAEIARNIQQGMVNEIDIDDLIQGVISQDGERWSDEDVVKVLQSIFKHGLDPENTGRLTSKMMLSGEVLTGQMNGNILSSTNTAQVVSVTRSRFP